MNAIDANILIYAVHEFEPAKQTIAVELLTRLAMPGGETVLPWQAVVEFLACLRRWNHVGRIANEVVLGHLQDARDMFAVAMPEVAVLDRSLSLIQRYSVSHWDSLMLAACLEAGADTLYSEDLNHGQDYDGLKVINPFLP